MEEKNSPNDAVDDREFAWWKAMNVADVQRVEQYMDERVSWGASPEMVNYVTLARFSALIQLGRESLRGMFTAEDFYMLSCVNPAPWWYDLRTNGYARLGDAIYWEYAHERDESPVVSELIRKLLELDVFQQMVLADVLECGWRSSSGPIAYALEALVYDEPAA